MVRHPVESPHDDLGELLRGCILEVAVDDVVLLHKVVDVGHGWPVALAGPGGHEVHLATGDILATDGVQRPALGI